MNQETKTPEALPHPRPLYAWTIVFLSILFNALVFTLQNSPTFITQDLVEAFHVNQAKIAYSMSFFYYAFVICQIPVGLLIDKFGSKKLPTLGIVLTGLGAILFSQSGSLLTAGTARFLIGAGGTFAFINGLKLISNWFPPRKFAFLLGMFLGVGALFIILLTSCFKFMMAVLGWREALLIFGLFGLILACFFFFIVQDSPGGGYSVHPKEQDIPFKEALKKVFNSAQIWVIGLSIGLVIGAVFSFTGPWGIPFLETVYQISAAEATLFIFIFEAGYAIGAIFFGRTSTSLGRRKIFIPWGIGIACLMLILIIYPPYLANQLVAISFFVLGLGASIVNLGYVIIHELNIPRVAGTAIAVVNTFYALFAAMNESLISIFLQLGAEVEHTAAFSLRSFQLALARTIVYLFIAFIFSFFIKETYCKQRYTYKD